MIKLAISAGLPSNGHTLYMGNFSLPHLRRDFAAAHSLNSLIFFPLRAQVTLQLNN